MWLIALLGLVLLIGLPFVLNSLITARYNVRIASEVDGVDVSYDTAVVFGAAVRNGYPTTMLRDRLDVAIALYDQGQIGRLIMSGDGRSADYDEPGVMARYAIQHGVPAEAITLDRAGLRTYDTCYRLSEVYGVSEAVLVTQAFHLPRALFTCEVMGIDAVGVSADQRIYRSAQWYDFREFIAVNVAVWDVLLRRTPQGGLEP